MIHVKNLKTLRKLRNHKEGELALVGENKVLYKYKDGNWTVEKTPPKGVTMSLYQINQSVFSSLPDITKDELEHSKEMINDYLSATKSKYYGLINNEEHYFTIFAVKPQYEAYKRLIDELIEALKNLGTIKTIDRDDDKFECWVTNSDGISHVYYLFDYSKGVIECAL